MPRCYSRSQPAWGLTALGDRGGGAQVKTHECYCHSVTTRRGELAGKDVHVTIAERDTGTVLVDEVATMFDNGFVGFWLPSGIDATITVAYEGYAASSDISTGPDAPTCLTTVKLVPAT